MVSLCLYKVCPFFCDFLGLQRGFMHVFLKKRDIYGVWRFFSFNSGAYIGKILRFSNNRRKNALKPIKTKRYWNFSKLLRKRIEYFVHIRLFEKLIDGKSEFRGEIHKLPKIFSENLLKQLKNTKKAIGVDSSPIIYDLWLSYVSEGVLGIDRMLKKSFLMFLMVRNLSVGEISRQKLLSDMRYPSEWFPGARALERKWYLHIGPTNSGKTYQALKKLEKARSGWFAGPLRLLAREVYDKMLSKGIVCNLITGEERIIMDRNAAVHVSTVEMVDLNKLMDVIVVDEVQMIADSQRGWAWTQVLLGAQASEIHLCGEESSSELISRIAESVGEELKIYRYERLSPLEPLNHSLYGDLKKIEPGDCIVTFSRKNIFLLKKKIEKATGQRCAVAYGGLPPETRNEQARLFNDPDNEYRVLVASDAIGMGLNLNIRRIVFQTLEKWNGTKFLPVSVSQIKQIAGRAGRYKSISANMLEASMSGYVTSLEQKDIRPLHTALSQPLQTLKKAILFPPLHIQELFASFFRPGTSLALIIRRFQKLSKTTGLYSILDTTQQETILELLESISDLTISERLILSAAPINLKDSEVISAFLAFATIISLGKPRTILEIPEVDLECLDCKVDLDLKQLERLEVLHKMLLIFLWLSNRFPAILLSGPECQEVKKTCENLINKNLSKISYVHV